MLERGSYMRIILNAGHTRSGAGTGAVGLLIESEESRKIVTLVKHYLRGKGHEVIIDNVDQAKSQGDYLEKVTEYANKFDADMFVSVHFNAGGGHGSECYTWKGRKIDQAVGVCDELNKLGFRNRGVKDGSRLYVIRRTKATALLIEVCFVDSKEDYKLYQKHGINKIAQAITRGILR